MQAAANDAHPAAERRAAPRRRGLRGAKLASVSADRSLDCTIRNLSTTGAKITMEGGELLPSDSWLIVGKEGLALRARTVWRHGAEFGVDFVEAHDLAHAPAKLAPLRRLWIDQLPR